MVAKSLTYEYGNSAALNLVKMSTTHGVEHGTRVRVILLNIIIIIKMQFLVLLHSVVNDKSARTYRY